MSITINNQPNQLNAVVLPDCIGAHNNSSPSLPPTQGSLVQDTGGPAGAIYSGTGLQWSLVGGGTSTVQGPGVSNVGDLVTWNNTSGNLLADSAIPSANVVTNTSSVVSGNLASFNGSGGRAIQDSGTSIVSTVVTPITFTHAFSGNNNYTGATMKLTKIVTSTVSMVMLDVEIQQQQTQTTPDTWTASAVIPSGYYPVATKYFPTLWILNSATLQSGAYFNVVSGGTIQITIPGSNSGVGVYLSNLSAVYYI